MTSAAGDLDHNRANDPLTTNYLESIDELLKPVTTQLLQGENDAAARADQFEIQLRRTLFEKLSPLLSSADPAANSTALSELGNLWVSILGICLHLAHFTSTAPVETTSANEEKQPEGHHYPDLLRKQIPILLLEDVIEILPVELSVKFWEDFVEPSYDMMFSDTLWSANSHACWLALVKVTVKLLRNNLPVQHAARVMQMVARVYPLSEKSAVKVWGSVNTENVLELESASFFETQQSDLLDSDHNELALNDEDGVIADYSFYESFWKLQKIFTIRMVLLLLIFSDAYKHFFAALESHKPDKLVDKGVSSRNTHKYLTSSRLLATQLRDTDFRVHVLTQFLVTAHHLTNQVDSLTPRLAEHIIKAKRLLRNMGADAVHHLKIVDSILETLEPQWRRWKQNKCKPDLDTPRQSIAGRKRKQIDETLSEIIDQEVIQSDSHYSVLAVKKDLPNLSRKMGSVVPSVDSHLEDYVEALDPDSGIEAEYHPKNESLFSWRALRLLSEQHVGRQFRKIGPNGDFEVAVRDIYKDENDLHIPGEAPVYNEVNLDEMHHSDSERRATDHSDQNEVSNENINNLEQQMRNESEVEDDMDAEYVNPEDDYRGDGDGNDDRSTTETGDNLNELTEEVPMAIGEVVHLGADERAAVEDNAVGNNGTSGADSTKPDDSKPENNQSINKSTNEIIELERPSNASDEPPAKVEKANSEVKSELHTDNRVSGESRQLKSKDQAGPDNLEHRRSPPRAQAGSDNRDNQRSPPKTQVGSDNRENRRSPPRGQAGPDDRRERRLDGGPRGDGNHVGSRHGGRTDGISSQGGQAFEGRRGMADAPKETRGRGNPPPNRGGARENDRGRGSDRRGGVRDHDRPRHENDRGRVGPPPPGRPEDTGRGPPPAPGRERRGDADWNGDRRRGGRRR